ncbi:MAG: OmpL47-type beta-barrel domain-containing protein, partial [Promethearchaeota archaeon]
DLFYGENAPQYNITIVEGNLDTMWYTLDDGITNITFTELTGIINQTAWDNKDDGPITIRFYANDTLGSLNYTDIIVYKDITTPISSIYYIPFGENNIVDKSTIFYLNATDDQGSGVSLIMYKINNSNWNIYTNHFNLSNYAYGYYNISYYAIDNAQNIEDVKTLLVLLKKPSDVNLIILGYDLIYLNSIIYIITIVLIVYYKKKK